MILPFLLNIEHCWPFISPHSKMKGIYDFLRKSVTPIMILGSSRHCFTPRISFPSLSDDRFRGTINDRLFL